MQNTTSKHISSIPQALLAAIGALVLVLALTAFPSSAQAQEGAAEATADITLSVTLAKPGDTITVQASNFRVGTEASFIYTSTITLGGIPIDGVASVDSGSGFLHAGRTTDSGLYIAEHIDIDPADTAPDGAFTAEFVVPDVPAGIHYLEVISCWGGPDEAYPEDGVAPCGTMGLGGGVNDRVALGLVIITGP